MSSDTPASAPNPSTPDAKKEPASSTKPAPAPRSTRGRLIAIATLAAVIAGGYLYWKLQQQATRPPAVAHYEAAEAGIVDAVPPASIETPSWPEAEDELAAPARALQPDEANEPAAAVTPREIVPPDASVASEEIPPPPVVPPEVTARLAALEARVAALAAAPPPNDAKGLAFDAAGELVTLAAQRLLLARDTNAAMAALRLAATRLASGEFPVQRRAVLADLAALEAFHDVDVASLAAELAAFARAAPTLPLATPAPITPTAEPVPVDGWRSLLAAIGTSLRTLVEVRDADETRDPLLNPAHAALARQQLALDLSAARVAVLLRDAGAFHAALTPAITELAGRFDAGDRDVTTMLARLRAMYDIDLAPTLPTLARSVDALAAAPVPAPAIAPVPSLPAAPAAETAL